jgi:serine/threonine protein kinase
VAEMFGRYELHELLGRGGMGEVYRATDTIRDRTVALKLLPKHLAEDESFKARFRREARLAARLNEPHIVPIHDFGEIDGQLFLDMRLVEGPDLGSVLAERGALPLDTAIDIISQVAAALDAAHESGLVHRDVKPSNVLLTGISDGDYSKPFAYLVDFGIARSSAEEATSLTATSATVGTIAYMSPERIRGERGDRRTDIYALACVLYEALTGRKAFDGEVVAIMYAHLHTPPPAVSALTPRSPPELDDVVRKGMAKDSEERYPTAGSLAAGARAALRAAGTQSTAVAPTEAPATTTTVSPTYTPAPSPYTPPPSPYTPTPPPQHQTPLPQHQTPPPPPQHQTPPPQRYTPPPPPQRYAPPPQHQTPAPRGPGSQPSWPSRPGGPPPTPRRRNVALIVGAVAAVVAAVVTVVVIAQSGGSSGAGPTPGPSTSAPSSGSSSSAAQTLDPGPTGNVVTWQNFTSFSKFVGTRDGDTAHALRGATCKIEGRESYDVAGIVDQVKCSYASSPVVIFIARFDRAQSVQVYLHHLLDTHYNAAIWTVGGLARGVKYWSASSDVDLTASICGLPTFLVQFYAPKDAKATFASVEDYWDAATFPDIVGPKCSDDFQDTAPGAKAVPEARSDKLPTTLTMNDIASFLERGDSTRKAVLVVASPGYEIMVVGQTGSVTFWRYRARDVSLAKIGTSTYPYEPTSLGPPYAVGRGTLLKGMEHATFIVDGAFSGDGSGNAVAYTTGAHGWGAIKAERNGNLAPSGAGVKVGKIGVGQAFDFVDGELETADCSFTIPISECSGDNRVLKFWSWSGTEFVLTRKAGLPR